MSTFTGEEAIRALDEMAEELQSASAELDAALVSHPRCSSTIRMRAGEAASDILRFLPLLSESHIQAVKEVADDIRQLHEVMSLFRSGRPPGRDAPRATSRLIVSYKALYFFISAYQDKLYSVISLLVDPNSPPGPNMSRAFNPTTSHNNPVRRFLEAELPDYVDWFPIWRDQRNQVKNGVSFSTGGPAPENGLLTIGVRFNEFTADGGVSVDCSKAVQLSDVVAALRVSAQLVRRAADLAGSQS